MSRLTRPKLLWNWRDGLRGLLIYASGDSIAAWIGGEFRTSRLLGMMLIGGTVYAIEIPHYFRWIDRLAPQRESFAANWFRTGLALLYFNPLWIARHLLFIRLCAGQWQAVDWGLLHLGALSFAANIPFSLIANYLIQNHLSMRWRFIGSAVFSALMAVYYPLSEGWLARTAAGPCAKRLIEVIRG